MRIAQLGSSRCQSSCTPAVRRRSTEVNRHKAEAKGSRGGVWLVQRSTRVNCTYTSPCLTMPKVRCGLFLPPCPDLPGHRTSEASRSLPGRAGLDLAAVGHGDVGDGAVFGFARAVARPRRCSPRAWPSRWRQKVSVSVPIWLILMRIELAMPLWMPSFRILVLVTNRSSPTS